MNAAARAPKRPLAPLVVEQWCTVAVLGVSVLVATAVAAEGARALSRQRRHKIGIGPLVPPAARIDSRRKTITLAVTEPPGLVLLVSVGAYDASPVIPIRPFTA